MSTAVVCAYHTVSGPLPPQFAYWLLYLKTVKICCDKFHFPNHANNPFCKENVNPGKILKEPPLDKTNSISAEEVRSPG